MRKAALLLGLAALAAACHHKPTPAERTAADDRAVSMVEAAQDRHGPIKPLAPQTMTVREIADLHLLAGCSFGRAGEGDPIVLVRPMRAIMKLDTHPAVFANDPGGPSGPLGTWEHYVGKGLSLRVTKGPGDGVTPGQDALQWPARVEVRDEYDRIVYASDGLLRCEG